jgi:hypothetical protein
MLFVAFSRLTALNENLKIQNKEYSENPKE